MSFFGIGYWVFGIWVYTYIHMYTCIHIYWALCIGVYTYIYKVHCTYVYTSIYWELRMMWYYMVNHHETTYGSDQRPIPICVMSMEVCYDMMVHGQLSWNNIRPVPTLNTNMSNLVWMICIMYWFHMMVHGHHLNNMRPKPRPNTNMSNLVWMIGIGLIWWSMVITETTYDPSQDPIPVCQI